MLNQITNSTIQQVMRKILLTLLVFAIGFIALKAQTTDLGTPRSWAQKSSIRNVPVYNMPQFDLQAQLEADAINEANKIGPWRFGYEHVVNYGLENGGDWTVLPNGDRIWRIAFRSDNALSMNILFDEFRLPEGATVYIYSEDRRQFEGAYTAANNNSEEILGTSLIEGSNIVVEYYEPAMVAGQGKLNIGTVIHGYKSLSLYASGLLKALNSSGKCNNDVKCPLGNGWENQINSVAIIIVGGSGACTGALVNNTSQDGTPYFLSANHCGTTGLGNWVFRFNWDSPVAICAQNAASQDPGAPFNQVNGAALRASSGGSDMALMQLNSTPTGDIYYAGWNRSATPATQATAIHHPSGDVKKISRENQAVTAQAWSGAQTWRVANWDSGTTEPGSSGSPLFDQNQRIIGQLYGGGAACSGLSNNGSPDYYGRFDISWTGGGSNSTRLSNWLDPGNTGVMTLDGYDPNATGVANDAGLPQVVNLSGTYCNQTSFAPEVVLRNYGTAMLTSATITYNLDGGTNSNYNWNGSLASGAVTTVTLPSITVSTSGSHNFNATVTAPNGFIDSNTTNNSASANFYVIANGQTVGLSLTTDCWGSETSWEVRSGSTVLFSNSSYPDQISTYNEPLCLPVGCYTFEIFDSYGDGLDGMGSGCPSNGNYIITDQMSNVLVQMTVVDFGNSTTHNFCVTSLPTDVANITIEDVVQNIQIYPNPNKGIFTVAVDLSTRNEMQLQVYNAMGQLLQNHQNEGAQNYLYDIDLSENPAGFYFVKVIVGGKVLTRKVIKQ